MSIEKSPVRLSAVEWLRYNRGLVAHSVKDRALVFTWKVHSWYASTSSESSDQVCISRSSGQGQGHRSKKWSVYPVLAGSKFRKPGPGSSIFGKKVRIRNVSITFCVSRSLVKVKVKVIAAKKPCLCMILFAGGLPSIKGNLVSN